MTENIKAQVIANLITAFILAVIAAGVLYWAVKKFGPRFAWLEKVAKALPGG